MKSITKPCSLKDWWVVFKVIMQETYLVETQAELIVENKKLSKTKKIGHNSHIFRQWVTKVLKMFEPLFQILYKF